MDDLINRADALEQMAQAECGLHYDDCEADNCSCSYIQRILDIPSADAVDCTDFIEWLAEEVMDEEMWELNAVAYGEIICRKLVKLGVLEVTEEPSYYIRPSADAERGFRGGKIPPKEMLDGTVLIPQHQWLEMERELAELKEKFESADAVKGKWLPIEETLPTYDGGEKTWLTGMKCSNCGKIFDLRIGYNFCPSCGARMKGGVE